MRNRTEGAHHTYQSVYKVKKQIYWIWLSLEKYEQYFCDGYRKTKKYFSWLKHHFDLKIIIF